MCSEPIVAQKSKSCRRLIEPQKVTRDPNAKSCSKVADHNLERPYCLPKIDYPFDHILDLQY